MPGARFWEQFKGLQLDLALGGDDDLADGHELLWVSVFAGREFARRRVGAPVLSPLSRLTWYRISTQRPAS